MHPAVFQEFSSSPGGLCPCGCSQGGPPGRPCSLRPQPSPLLSRLLSHASAHHHSPPRPRGRHPSAPDARKCGHIKDVGWSANGRN